MKSIRCGTKTISHLRPKIWKLSPEEYKEIDSLSVFKRKISNWETDEFPYRHATSGVYLSLHLSFHNSVHGRES